jgi:hypothetical protein
MNWFSVVGGALGRVVQPGLSGPAVASIATTGATKITVGDVKQVAGIFNDPTLRQALMTSLSVASTAGRT